MADQHSHEGGYGQGPWKDLPSGVQRVALVDADGSIQSIDNILPAFHRNHHNEQTEPLGANEVFTGDFHDMANMPAVLIIYATDAEPMGVFMEWSEDGETVAEGPYDVMALGTKHLGNLWVSTAVQNLPNRRYMRLSIVNGETPQTFVLALVTCLKGNFTGFFVGPDDPLPVTMPSLITRSILAGQSTDEMFCNIKSTQDGELASVVLNDLRPSQVKGRTHVSKAVTAPGTIYTPAEGKTFYLTSIVYSLANNALMTLGKLALQDGTVSKLPFVVAAKVGTTLGVLSGSQTFPEPIPFENTVALAVQAGTLDLAVTVVGYEE